MPLEFPGHEPIRRTDVSDEITVEGEPWTGLIVVVNTFSAVEPGSYGLVQASEWKWTGDPEDPERLVTVWRGPDKPDEKVARKYLVDMDCATVLVDENGFYTCPPIIDLLHDEVIKMAEERFNEEANQRSAEVNSYIDHERVREKYDTDDVLVIATSGDAIAENGEYVGQRPKIPRGWVRLEDEGGRTMGGDEEEVALEWVAEAIARDLSEKLNRPIDEETVGEILKKEYDPSSSSYIMWGSDSGEVEVYVPRKVFLAHEKEEERKARIALEKRAREAIEYHKRQEELRRKAEEDRRAMLRRGGYPESKDWSPKGKFPGEYPL
jgi:hypothetical protein